MVAEAESAVATKAATAAAAEVVRAAAAAAAEVETLCFGLDDLQEAEAAEEEEAEKGGANQGGGGAKEGGGAAKEGGGGAKEGGGAAKEGLYLGDTVTLCRATEKASAPPQPPP